MMTANIRPKNGSTATVLVLVPLTMILLGLSGCGRSGEPSPTADAQSRASGAAASAGSNRPALPVAAISTNAEQSEGEFPLPSPEKGTPEWMLREIARIRTNLSSTEDGSPLSEASRGQHEKIIELARQAVAATHQDAQREQIFNNAVHYLSDARLALALSGDTQQSQLLVEDADSLYRRDRKSFSAVESAYKVVQLAQRKAEQEGRTNPEWLREFANQSRLFAEKFPHEPNRSALVLLTAGQLCDREGMTDAATGCFTMVQNQFPDTIFAEQVNGFLRRLSLIGQPLELAGPTIEGGYVSIDDYQGQDVLVVFWAATSPQFQQDCDRLKEVQQQFAERGLRVIGVNLDVDEGEIDQFLGERALPWPHIFYSEPENRGGRHPLARYYGVQRVPTYWLVDPTGIVTAAPSDLDELLNELQKRVGSS